MKHFSEDCRKEIWQEECETKLTNMTNFDVLQEQLGDDPKDLPGRFIVINLTPTLLEKNFFENENRLIVMNRLITFISIFTCFSMCEIAKNFVTTYLFKLSNLYNFQFIIRLAYYFVLLLFLLNSGLMLYFQTTAITKTYNAEVMKKN